MQKSLLATALLLPLLLSACAAPRPAPAQQPPSSTAPASASALSGSAGRAPLPGQSASAPAELQPNNPSTELRGVKVLAEGKQLRLLVPGEDQYETVGVRYVPASTADEWNAKPTGYGIGTKREGDAFTFANYTVIPPGTYHILVVDGRLHHAEVTATIGRLRPEHRRALASGVGLVRGVAVWGDCNRGGNPIAET